MGRRPLKLPGAGLPVDRSGTERVRPTPHAFHGNNTAEEAKGRSRRRNLRPHAA